MVYIFEGLMVYIFEGLINVLVSMSHKKYFEVKLFHVRKMMINIHPVKIICSFRSVSVSACYMQNWIFTFLCKKRLSDWCEQYASALFKTSSVFQILSVKTYT